MAERPRGQTVEKIGIIADYAFKRSLGYRVQVSDRGLIEGFELYDQATGLIVNTPDELHKKVFGNPEGRKPWYRRG